MISTIFHSIRGEVRHLQEGMELQGQGRGLCISFSWLVNDKTLIGEAPELSLHLCVTHPGMCKCCQWRGHPEGCSNESSSPTL